jgi:cytidylate kinase
VSRGPVPIVTVDGPSGSGKGTLSSALGHSLGWVVLDSGALYRAIALETWREKIEIQEAEELEIFELINSLNIELKGAKIYINGEDISEDIRTEEVGLMASKIASNAKLRRGILDFQRSFIRSPGLVADGRDMGTVVFPEAQLKIFLTASASVRGERRFIQLKNKGLSVSLPDLVRQIKERDSQDENRQIAPLKAAQEAVILDSSENTIEEVFDLAMLEVRKRGLAV